MDGWVLQANSETSSELVYRGHNHKTPSEAFVGQLCTTGPEPRKSEWSGYITSTQWYCIHKNGVWFLNI